MDRPDATGASLPIPPDELIDRVYGGFHNDEADRFRDLFLSSGQQSLADLELALAAIGSGLSNHRRILEFGCGCGRIMRWMDDLDAATELVGTDIDAHAIAWASENLPFATFDVNEAVPPTRYADGEFDLVLNHSVFTHLDAGYQDLWLEELRRITATDGLLVLSVHGEHAFAASEAQLEAGSRYRREWREQIEREGMLFIAQDSYVGSAFPDFYHTTFHAPWYVFEHWSKWFDVLAYLPRSSLDFQDQVVLRRRAGDGAGSPIRARAQPGAPAPAAGEPHVLDFDAPLEPLDGTSRFGPLGLVGRRVIFRAARPVLHAQHRVDLSLAGGIRSLDERLQERMPPLVHVALRQQAERIGRLEAELQRLAAAGDTSPESGA